jgi:hypothetical protein
MTRQQDRKAGRQKRISVCPSCTAQVNVDALQPPCTWPFAFCGAWVLRLAANTVCAVPPDSCQAVRPSLLKPASPDCKGLPPLYVSLSTMHQRRGC